jgi:hypothetical protein
MAAVLASTNVSERLYGDLRQAERVVQFPEGEQSGIGRELGTMEFKLQAAVKPDPQTDRLRFTRRIVHHCTPK